MSLYHLLVMWHSDVDGRGPSGALLYLVNRDLNHRHEVVSEVIRNVEAGLVPRLWYATFSLPKDAIGPQVHE